MKAILHTLAATALLVGAARVTAAEATPAAPPAPEQKRPGRFLTAGAGLQSVSFDGDNAKNTALYGASVSLGGYFPTSHPVFKNALLVLDVGVFFGDNTDLMFDVPGPYLPPAGLPVPDMTQHDILSRKSDYFTVPVLLTLAYDFRLGESFSLRAGPSLGFTFISVENDFSGGIDIYDADGAYNGRTNPIETSKSGSKALFTYGVTLGATWNILQNFALDLQYRFSGNTGLNFGAYRDYGASLAHQGVISAVWRF